MEALAVGTCITPARLKLGVPEIAAHGLQGRVLEVDARAIVPDCQDPMPVFPDARVAAPVTTPVFLLPPGLDHEHHGFSPAKISHDLGGSHGTMLPKPQAVFPGRTLDLVRMAADALV